MKTEVNNESTDTNANNMLPEVPFMRILKKIIGYILVCGFVLLSIGCFIYNIYNTGWYFIACLFGMLLLIGAFFYGLFLLSDKSD